jgi:hypothetical protein
MEMFKGFLAAAICFALGLLFSYLTMTLGWGMEVQSWGAFIGFYLLSLFFLVLVQIVMKVD